MQLADGMNTPTSPNPDLHHYHGPVLGWFANSDSFQPNVYRDLTLPSCSIVIHISFLHCQKLDSGVDTLHYLYVTHYNKINQYYSNCATVYTAVYNCK